MSENNRLPVPVSSGEIINAVANQLSILKKIIPGGKKIVLVVDDDEHANRLICEDIHESFADRIRTIQFFDGKPAYEYLLENLSNVHLIISCILMPKMDGIKFLRLCKELNPQLPFIIYSAIDYKASEYKANPATSAADAYIVKSVENTELLNTVEKFLFASDTAQEINPHAKAPPDGLIASLSSKDATTQGENAAEWYKRGREALFNGQWDEARVAFTKAIEPKPDDEMAYYIRGCSYGNLDNYQQAINDFTKAIELKPDYSDAYYRRAVEYGRLGNYQQAINDFTKAIELKPDDEMAYYYRAVEYDRLGNNQQAINDFKIAARLGDEAAQDLLSEKGIQWEDIRGTK
jgi:tetratricopeptide (TPR) repeat protein